MKYLLDVNALLAVSHAGPFYQRLRHWVSSQNGAVYSTCAITELGFIRVSMIRYKFDRATAERALAYAKQNITGYIDTLPPPRLAAWANKHSETTDSYLCQLAAANGMKLATFDQNIKDPAACLIP